MQKLQITQCFDSIQTIYNQNSVTWIGECAEFVINENELSTGYLIAWLDGVVPEQISTELDSLERKIDAFLLAMQVMNNPKMRKNGDTDIRYTAKNGHEFPIKKELLKETVDIILNGGSYLSASLSISSTLSSLSCPVSLPAELPKISLEFQRLIGFFSSAEDFSGDYQVEHQLRNYCLILEELMHEGKISKSTLYDSDLWQVRNFISHAKCHSDKLCSFIETNFLEAIIDESGKKYAKFDNTQNSHINFICQYRHEAYQWVKQELAKELS